MAKKKRKSSAKSKVRPQLEISSTAYREIWAIFFIGLSVLTALSIFNMAGTVGRYWEEIFRVVFGKGIYIFPLLFLSLSISMLFSEIKINLTRVFGLFVFVFSSLGFFHTYSSMEDALSLSREYGGMIGFSSSYILIYFLGILAARVVLMCLVLASFIISFDVSIKNILVFLFNRKAKKKAKKSEVKIKNPFFQNNEIKKPHNPIKIIDRKSVKKIEKKPALPIKTEAPKRMADEGWETPPLDLLEREENVAEISEKDLRKNAKRIKEKLAEFSIPVTVKEVHVGPSVAQYTLLPEEGVKLAKITSLKNDIALALSASAIRIEAPIPGKGLVGIEIPNNKRRVVKLRDMLESKEFKKGGSSLKLPLGQDVAGHPVIDSLEKMPHLLVAGSTGSGKSVGMNVFLISLIYQNSPADLKMIMIDPKRVELSSYNGIPHLLTPVITDPENAVSALRWAVAEMNRRYKVLQEDGSRNIEDFNKKTKEKMPKMVIIIDEFADLMMTKAKKEVENSICRLAQMARAVGMHLIVATQRPSVDVITGLVKANIPSRIAYTVSSGIDSRTIIDAVGAEDLLGMGDMLYLSGNSIRSVRLQGIFISSSEIEKVTNRAKLTLSPEYNEEIISSSSSAGGSSDGEGGDFEDDMCQEAIRVITESNKASASLLQRRLSVGYARAARILDILEEKGYIGPANGAKPRDIYVDSMG